MTDKSVTLFICGRGRMTKHAPKKSWRGSLLDVNGEKIQDLTTQQLNRIAKPSAAMCMFGSEPFSSALRMSNLKRFKYDWIWEKRQGTGHLNAKKIPLKSHEIISIFYSILPKYNPQFEIWKKWVRRRTSFSENYGKQKPVTEARGGSLRYPKTVLKIAEESRLIGRMHPTQKPVALLEYLIKTYTQEGDTVLDPTMGSGSTGVACKNLGRNFIGIELDETYFKIAQSRIESDSL